MLLVPGTVIVTGTPGAGKSTLLSSIAEDKNFTLVSVGTIMLEFASKDKFAAGRDDLRHKSNAEQYSELRNKAFAKIGALKGNVVVDTHGSIEAEGTGRYVPGLPMESLRLIKDLKGFIYVDAHTDRILEEEDGRHPKEERGGSGLHRHAEAGEHLGALVLFFLLKYPVVRNIQQAEHA